MTRTMLKVTGLTSGYVEAAVLNSVDLDIPNGQIFALLGKNGMGKSTLLKSIIGFLPKMTGRVEFDGRDVLAIPPHRLSAPMASMSCSAARPITWPPALTPAAPRISSFATDKQIKPMQ